MFPFAFIQLISGALSDVKGRFSVILFGLIIFGCGTVIAILSSSLISYAIANILGGIGFGFVNPVLIALMTDITPESNVSKKVGLLVAIANLGVGLGPIIAGQIVIISWRYLYIIFIIITVIAFGFLYFLRQPTTEKSQSRSISLFFRQMSRELHRPVVILMILSAFFASQTYLAAITWTSRSFTGVVTENVSGIIIGLAGLFGAISSLVIGFLIKKYGILSAILTGIGSLFIALFLLLSLGDITKIEVLIFDAGAYMLLGTSGGALISTVMYYSQILSKESRGTLAGLATFGQFIGNALVPITYDYIFYSGGVQAVYYTVLIVTLFLIIVLGFLYNIAKKI
jgi:MFS family permease